MLLFGGVGHNKFLLKLQLLWRVAYSPSDCCESAGRRNSRWGTRIRCRLRVLRGDDEFAADAAFLHVRVGLDDVIEGVDLADGDHRGAVTDGLQEFLEHTA